METIRSPDCPGYREKINGEGHYGISVKTQIPPQKRGMNDV